MAYLRAGARANRACRAGLAALGAGLACGRLLLLLLLLVAILGVVDATA